MMGKSKRRVRLSGKVCCKGKPVVHATVMLFDAKWKPLLHTRTDKNGVFCFLSLIRPGEYILIVFPADSRHSDFIPVKIKDKVVSRLNNVKNR